MYESSFIIRSNIKHYRALLGEIDSVDVRQPTIMKLLAEAQAQLPLATASESESKS